MSVVVHRYLASVRKVQRAIRDFLHCKHAKVITLEKMWMKLELQYVRKKIEQKKAHIKDLQSAKKSTDKRLLELDNKAFLEMKQQAQQWSKIDIRMESMVSTLKAAGVIVEEKEEDIVGRLLIPNEIRYETLQHIVERNRKDFHAGQRTMARKLVDQDATFKEHHAKELLLGKSATLERIINDKFNKRLVVLKYKPFLFFRALDKKLLWDKIREIHHQRETFKIKVDKVTETPSKKRENSNKTLLPIKPNDMTTPTTTTANNNTMTTGGQSSKSPNTSGKYSSFPQPNFAK